MQILYDMSNLLKYSESWDAWIGQKVGVQKENSRLPDKIGKDLEGVFGIGYGTLAYLKKKYLFFPIFIIILLLYWGYIHCNIYKSDYNIS
jgi:hypothetical protein